MSSTSICSCLGTISLFPLGQLTLFQWSQVLTMSWMSIISDFCILLVRHPTFSWGGGWGQHFPSLLSVDKYSYINVYLIFITTSSIKYIETSGKCWDQNIYFLLIKSVQDWAGITFNLLDQRPGVQLLPPSLNQRGVELQLYHGFEELGVKSAFPPSR